jgi:hypothetical protein
MWKWKYYIVFIVIVAVVVVTVVRNLKVKSIEDDFLKRQVQFSAYAHSIDGLDVIPLYQDPEKTVEERYGGHKIPDSLFQTSVRVKERLGVLDSITVLGASGEIRFFLVKTEDALFGYIPQYRLEDGSGKPLEPPPAKGENY